jgi:hypothetical protein
MLTTHPHLLRGLLSGAIPLILLYVFVEWRRKSLYPSLPLLSPRHKIDDNTRADRKVRFPYLLKINNNIYFQNQIHNMKA